MSFLQKNDIRSHAGQTLIEVLVGLSAAVVVISAITVTVISSLNNTEYGRDQNLATHYSQEGIEIIRNMRDQNIASIAQSSIPDGNYCLANGCSALVDDTSKSNSPASYCGPRIGLRCGQNIDNFVREITIEHNSSTCNGNGPTNAPTPTTPLVKVTVITYWGDTKCTDSNNQFCHSVLLTSCLSDFTVVPTP